MSGWGALFQSEKKWSVFGYVLVAIVIVGTVLSLLTKVSFIEDNKDTRPVLVIVAPQSSAGASIREGAMEYVRSINAGGGVEGRPLEVIELDSANVSVADIASNPYIIGAVGFSEKDQLMAAYDVFKSADIPLVTPVYLSEQLDGVVSLGAAPKEMASFTANYARNIVQQRLMYVIRQEGAEYDAYIEPFASVYDRFQTPLRASWSLSAEATDQEIAEVIELAKAVDIGALYLVAEPVVSAKIVAGIRAAGSILDIYGGQQLATNEFVTALQSIAGDDYKSVLNGVSTTSSMLFDTANNKAQRFKTAYQDTYKKSPDWLAALAYEGAHIALMGKSLGSVSGITGSSSIARGRIELPLQMGVYNGQELISAPIQMMPIAKGANFNYVDALKDGRVLYVNDRFMFKTNVVYTGFTINEIKNVDRQAETADINMSMWVRYQGDFNPEDVEVLNASNNTIEFGEPEEVSSNGDVQYKRYRIEDTFKLNFTGEKRAYDHHIAGISFRHRMLNRNNLLYVVDVLGMPTGNAFIDDLKSRKVTESGAGWAVNNAWVSQDVKIERGQGAPQYVGITGEEPLFSIITLGVEIKPQALAARDVISVEYFIYIAIFGLIGVIFANILDSRKRAWYWAVQSWILRLIFWPMLLLALGNLLIDWSYNNATQVATAKVVIGYESLWWLLAAHLSNLAINRFVWTPLESRAERKIPNVMKLLVTILILSLALAGIIGFVFNNPLTSLLATSGVLAMIVGFAVQANIANIFSGIILNVERPFKVGDFIKINNTIGQVRDITWRTVRVESNAGPMVSLANSTVSESFMENYSQVPHGILSETVIYTPADVDAEKVLGIVNEAIAQNRSIIMKDDPMYEPRARFKGIENVAGQWVAKFSAGYRVKILPKKSEAAQDMWIFIRKRFAEEGIPLATASASGPVIIEQGNALAV